MSKSGLTTSGLTGRLPRRGTSSVERLRHKVRLDDPRCQIETVTDGSNSAGIGRTRFRVGAVVSVTAWGCIPNAHKRRRQLRENMSVPMAIRRGFQLADQDCSQHICRCIEGSGRHARGRGSAELNTLPESMSRLRFVRCLSATALGRFTGAIEKAALGTADGSAPEVTNTSSLPGSLPAPMRL
jgi:hypothetical protein